jgi:bacteriocin biosynthesis cyclodehydratase domain-containing protein
MSNKTLKLQASYAYYPVGAAAVEVASIVRSKRLRLEGPPGGKLETALSILSRGVTADDPVGELTRRAGLSEAGATRLIETLKSHDALVHREPKEEEILADGHGLYDRQIRFFRLFETEDAPGSELNRRLQNRKVMIVGVGGVGGWIALMCARMGIRHVVGVDPDRVETSNLHRQILYTRADTGRLKVEAAADALSRVDDAVRFEGHPIWIHSPGDLSPLLDEVDLVFNPFGYVPSLDPTAQAVAQAALERGVPSIPVAVTMVGPLTVPGRTACYWCAWSNLDASEHLDHASKAAAPGTTRGEPWPYLPALPPRQAIAAGLAVWEAVRFLSGMDHPRSLDGVIMIDTLTYEGHRFLAVPRDARCARCGSRSGRRVAPGDRAAS